MARDVTVTLSNGEVLVYKGVPSNVTPEQIEAKAKADGGADVVEINGGAPAPEAPGAPEPAAEAAPAAPEGPDVAGFEKELGAYYQSLGGKPLDTGTIGSLAQKYRVGTPTNLADIEEFYRTQGTLNHRLQMTGPEAPPPPVVDPNEIVVTVPRAGDMAQRARAYGKGLLFDFADELEAAGRMLANGELSGDEYYRIKSQINADYNAWAKANPEEALGLELAGGVTGAFIPGVGQIGTGMRGLRAGEALGSTLLAGAKSGAISGALSGAGQAETMAPSDLASSIALNTAIGGGAGAGFGKLTELGGRGFASGRDAVLRRMGRETGDAAERRAAEVLYGSTPSPERAVGATALSQRYGVPTPLGVATPELAALTEKVLAKNAPGSRDLATRLVETQADAGTRVGQQVEDALPGAQDFFTAEDQITRNLRRIGEQEYQRAFQYGTVNDRQLTNIVNNPQLSNIWKQAQDLAELEGRPLALEMEPVLDVTGALVGIKPTGRNLPDVEALHFFKRALDDAIDAGFRGTASGGKARAVALRDSIRAPFVARLDEVVPEYAAARAMYAGDMEVRDALRFGRTLLSNKLRSQQFERELANMSVAEREALRTGARQAILEPLEDATTNRNFAQRLRGVRGDSGTMQKLQMVMDPQEYRFFERALRREDELFKRVSGIRGGSRTAPLAEGMAALDDMISSGNIPEAVNFILAPTPGRIATMARWISNLNPGKEFGDKVYAKLSQALSANNPEELREVLDMLARSRSYGEYMARVKQIATGPVAGVAGNVAPSTVEDRSPRTPPTLQTGEEEISDKVLEEAQRAIEMEAGADENPGLSYGEAAEDGTAPFKGASLGERNLNPGNIIDGSWARKQPGYAGPGEGGFAKFETMAAGSAAQRRLIAGKMQRGENTVDSLIDSYLGGDPRNTPESTANYKAYVAKRLGLGLNDRIPPSMVRRASQAMIEFETGNQSY